MWSTAGSRHTDTATPFLPLLFPPAQHRGGGDAAVINPAQVNDQTLYLYLLLAGIEKRHHAAPAKEPLFRRKAQASCFVGVTHLHRTTAKLRQWPPPASILLRPRLRRMYSIPVIAGMMDSQNQRAPSKGTAQEA